MTRAVVNVANALTTLRIASAELAAQDPADLDISWWRLLREQLLTGAAAADAVVNERQLARQSPCPVASPHTGKSCVRFDGTGPRQHHTWHRAEDGTEWHEAQS